MGGTGFAGGQQKACRVSHHRTAKKKHKVKHKRKKAVARGKVAAQKGAGATGKKAGGAAGAGAQKHHRKGKSHC